LKATEKLTNSEIEKEIGKVILQAMELDSKGEAIVA